MKKRNYSFDTVRRLQGSIRIDHTLARLGADKLRTLLANEPYINTLGAYNGQQAVQHAKAGLKAIYLSGWQVAAANNTANTTYPDQSLYPVDSVPRVVKGINNAFRRADQIDCAEGKTDVDYFLPIVADAEAGFGGALNAYELMSHMIEAGAAGVHFEDQLASEKKCGHLGGKVLVPTSQMIRTLNAARLAADVAGVDTVIMARTDAEAATLITSDHDPLDSDFIIRERTEEGFFHYRNGIEACIQRGLAYAPYADLLWFETSTPDIQQATRFAQAIHAGMAGYSEMQEREFAAQSRGFTTVKHQREVGVGYFDLISEAVGAKSTAALAHSTETDQF